MTYQFRFQEDPFDFSYEFDEYEGGLFESEPEFEPESDEFETAFADHEEEEEEARRGSRAPGSTIRSRTPPVQLHRPPPRRRRPPRTIIRPWRVSAGVIHEPSTCTCPEQTCPQHGSEYIRWVQSTLNRVLGMRLPLNGVLTPATRSAVRSFQERERLPVTGIVGPDLESASIAARDGRSPKAEAAKGAEPGMLEPPEPTATPPEPDSAKPAAEFDFEWETDDEEFEDADEITDAELNRIDSEQDLEFTDQEGHSELTRPVPKTIWRHNTDLDAPYFGGNFNFLYNGGSYEALITFNTHLSYRKKYSDSAKRNFINNLRRAVAVWDSAAEVQVRDINGNYNDKIKLRFRLNIVRDPKNSNKKTDVHPSGTRSTWFIDKNRETVMRELNAFIGSSRNVLVHELGHVWGLLDEYDTRWIEKKFSLGHVGTGSPLIKDKIAIMNEGYVDETGNTGEFRGRYFKHFGRAILNAFWGLKNYVIPIKHNGKVVSRQVQGRIVLLKKDIAGSAPYSNDVLPFNAQFTSILVAKR